MGSNAVHVKLVRVASRGAPLSPPSYQTAGAAGADLQADLERPLTLVPGQRALVPTGFAIELPAGYEAQIRARSGLAVRSGVGLPNGPGTVDSDYRGEIQVALINWGHEPVTIQRGDRCSVSASALTKEPSAPVRPTRYWPTRSRSAGSRLATTSTRPRRSARQVASIRGADASIRTNSASNTRATSAAAPT